MKKENCVEGESALILLIEGLYLLRCTGLACSPATCCLCQVNFPGEEEQLLPCLGPLATALEKGSVTSCGVSCFLFPGKEHSRKQRSSNIFCLSMKVGPHDPFVLSQIALVFPPVLNTKFLQRPVCKGYGIDFMNNCNEKKQTLVYSQQKQILVKQD